MGYKVKWVEDNLGVSRKAIRNFERLGLMPKNEGGAYRDYSDEDIERIWTIRVFQGMGYTLREILDMTNDENLDFENSLQEKIKQLEKKKYEIDSYLGYARTIKCTGRFPSRPKELGSVRFEEFHKKSLDEWNIENDPQVKQFQTIADLILAKTQEEWTESDLNELLNFLSHFKLDDLDVKEMLNEYCLSKAIINRMSLGVKHPEVQLLVKLIYENIQDMSPELKEISPKQFARIYSLSYVAGDAARLKELNLGENECRFIADAMAVFGGYSGIEDPELY